MAWRTQGLGGCARRWPIARAVLLLVVAVLAGCNSEKKRDLADFAHARQLLDGAMQAVTDGRIDDAHRAFCEQETLLTTLRARSGKARFGDETLPPGRIIGGQTVADWQEQWKGEFRAHVVDSFESLHEKALAGGLDWLSVRSFFTTYGDRALDERWQRAVEGVDTAHADRMPEAYLWDCQTVLEGYCEALRAAVGRRSARPLSTESFLTGAARNARLGMVEVRAWLGADATYQHVQVGGGQAEVLKGYKSTLPTRLTVTIEVKTNRGTSSWDGFHRMMVDLEAPPTFSLDEADAAWRRQVARLQESMAARLETLEPQTLTTTP